MAKDNKSLGKFLLTGIPPAPRGVPQIEVSFDIDVNGILNVSASDKGTGRAQSIRITNTGGLSAREVDKMRQEAEQYAEFDRIRLKRVEITNQAESLFYSYEMTMKENRNLISPELKARIDEKKQKLEAGLRDTSLGLEILKLLLHDFQQDLLSVGTDVYQQPQQPQRLPQQEQIQAVTKEQIVTGLSSITQVGMPEGEDFNTQIETLDDDEEEFSFDFDRDETVTGDYEAID
jgi:molecular chaperone DnaK